MIALHSGASVAQYTPNDSVRAQKPDTVIDIERHSTDTDTLIEMLCEGIPAEQRSPLSAQDATLGLMSVEDALNAIITEQLNSADNATQQFVDGIAMQMSGEAEDSASIADSCLVIDLALFENSNHSSGSDSFIQRGQIILKYLGEQLGKLLNNEFEGDLGRWAANLTISGLRTGLVTGTLTVIRQLVGFALEKTLQSNAASPLTRSVIGVVAQSIGPLLNILGAIRDECNGTANAETRMARSITLAVSALALTAAIIVPTALPALASFSSQMAFYTFAQDLVGLFFPTGDNAKPNPGGTAAAGALNGMFQFLSFTGMNYTAPHSGPGYVMAQGSTPPASEPESFAFQLSAWAEQQANIPFDANLPIEARAAQIVESLAPILKDDVARGGYNGAADVLGQVILGQVMHALQENPSEEGFRVKPMSGRIPTAEQVADQFLSTNAIRTSIGQIITATVIAASRFFSELPIPKEMVDHMVNTVVAMVVFVVRPGTTYVNARTAVPKNP
ncbi:MULTISPECIES: hypothetical protein [unclassified Pseudomonas]|uniref:hypothetical protein n=1 Tax=unclassified Pseudomonas TaxID=196821 RepID=UPI0008712F13|nr:MULTISPECIES: hypothetical protein [unclassified Pseudomonas]SCW44946.1 hypothetical protein SAMN03159481_00856 [Pseudomonas sp. NFACC56-3]SFK22604.1 hypothetical protein SAMN03159473_00854 [Pseudomonas sp. NFACC52]